MSDAIEFHSRIATRFDGAYAVSPAFRERLAVWRELIRRYAVSDMRVLDAGCGPGSIAREAAPLATGVLGFDGSPRMIERAQARSLPNMRFEVARLETVVFADAEAFDLVLASSILEYCHPFWPAFDRLIAALSPTGTLLVSLPDARSLYRRAEKVIFCLSGRPRYLAHTHPVPSESEFEAGLAERGLRILECRSYGASAFLPRWSRRALPQRLTGTLIVYAIRRAA